MAKITKHAEFMETLHGMVTKTAGTKTANGPANTTGASPVTGVAGKDTHYESSSKENEHVNKNEEGHPEHNPQEFKQDKATDKSDPTKKHKSAEEIAAETETDKKAAEEATAEEKTKEANSGLTLPDTKPAAPAKLESPTTVTQHAAKKAEDETVETPSNEKLAELGKQLLATIEEMNKKANAPANSTGASPVTGVPGKDTHYTSSSKENEHVNKNKEGHPEHNPQEFKQDKATDKSDPTKKHKSAEEENAELDKEASFELGRQFARAFLSTKNASVDTNIYKEAGRKDFEALIAQASTELEQEHDSRNVTVKKASETFAVAAVEDESQIKQAEEAGAQAFYALLKQAQEEEQANQVKLAFEQKLNSIMSEKSTAEKRAQELAAKVAKYEEAIEKKAEEEKLDNKFAEWGSRVVDSVIARLKSETVK